MSARPCVLCGFDLAPTELLTCAACVGAVRLDLTQIRECFALLRVQVEVVGQPAAVTLGTVMGVGNDDVAVADALVMLGPGADGGEGLPSDPPAVAFELWQWQQDWAEIRGESAHDHQLERNPGVLVHPGAAGRSVAAGPVSNGHSVPALVSWLGTRLGWAMSYHPAADEFAHDMGRIRAKLQAVTDTADFSERGASCPYCGTTLLREYGDTGRADDWSCRRCHRAFDEFQYRLALRAALEAPAVGG